MKLAKKNNLEMELDTDRQSLPILAKSLLIGVLAGVVVSVYRLILQAAEGMALSAYTFVSGNPRFILPMFLVLAVIGYIVGLIIKKEPMVIGSGVQQVKNLIAGRIGYSWWRMMIAKIVGSTLSTVGGLALGREGPCVQLGGCVGQGVGDKFGRSHAEKKILIGSGAGAGMGAALNAPLAGVMFVIEEVFKYISPIILLSALTGAVSAQFVCRSVFGIEPLLHFAAFDPLPLSAHWMILVFGILLGVIGAFYGLVLLHVRRIYAKIRVLVPVLRPVVPFLIAGVIGLVLPMALGSGHHTIEELNLAMPIGFLLILLVVKFFFIILCLGSNSPGGDLFPLLVLGGMMGAAVGQFAINYLGVAPEYFSNFVVLGMAGYFAAIVGAPMTAIVLLVEMTGSFQQMLSLTMICLVSYTVINLLKQLKVYRQAEEMYNKEMDITPVPEVKNKHRVTLEAIVHHGAFAADKTVQDLCLPEHCLVVDIKRDDVSIVPTPTTKILAGDYLTVVTDGGHEAEAFDVLDKLASVE